MVIRGGENKITDRSRKKQASSIEDLAYENEEGELLLPQLLSIRTILPQLTWKLFWEEIMALDELPGKQRTVFIRNEMRKWPQEIADMEMKT